MVLSTTSLSAGRFATSHETNVTSPDLLSRSRTSAWPSSSPRAQNTIFAPAAANDRTHPSPIPLLPPVIITTLFWYLIADASAVYAAHKQIASRDGSRLISCVHDTACDVR